MGGGGKGVETYTTLNLTHKIVNIGYNVNYFQPQCVHRNKKMKIVAHFWDGFLNQQQKFFILKLDNLQI